MTINNQNFYQSSAVHVQNISHKPNQPTQIHLHHIHIFLLFKNSYCLDTESTLTAKPHKTKLLKSHKTRNYVFVS